MALLREIRVLSPKFLLKNLKILLKITLKKLKIMLRNLPGIPKPQKCCWEPPWISWKAAKMPIKQRNSLGKQWKTAEMPRKKWRDFF